MNLTATEARVLGCLIEKDITTPDNYPLSLNSLINACNQKSNRDPVMNLDEQAVRDALEALHEKRLAGTAGGAESRVTKYEHYAYDTLQLGRREIAILCELLIRGPQTPGELRGRADRMHHFEDISDVLSTLQKVMQRETPLVTMLPRQPGTKESRYAQLMSGEAQTTKPQSNPLNVSGEVSVIERQLEELRTEVEQLKERVSQLEQGHGKV